MDRFEEFLSGVTTCAIAGHVSPDGDCAGSVMGTYLYLKENYPGVRADVYLEPASEKFSFLEDMDKVRHVCRQEEYDLLILLDISSKERIGVAGGLLATAKKTLCIDHHRTNPGGFTWFFNDPDASSASEMAFHFMDPDRITKACAEALYLGMVHDTGVFQYSSTSPETMRTAAVLMEKGIDFSRIVDETFYQKTYIQNQVMGRVLMESILLFGGQLIIGCLKWKDLDFYGVTAKDLDGIVAQLRNTEGVEAAIFIHETDPGMYKVSLRSRHKVDVSQIARHFGGGGHIRAAGCSMAAGSVYDVINSLTVYFEKELEC